MSVCLEAYRPRGGIIFTFKCDRSHRIQRTKSNLDLENIFMGTILLIILILLLVGALPTWPYSSGWGYYPTGGLGLLFIILLVLVLMGRI
jgi:hypothetical protein